MVLQGQPLLYTISTLTALTFCLIGYDNGVVGGLTQTPGWNRTFGTDTDANLLSTIVSIYEIGAAVGALLTFAIGEKFGRRRTISFGAIWMIVGAVLQAAAINPPMIIAARVISGIGMGLLNSTAPVLQAEVSPKASRGRYVCAQLSTLNFGIMLSYWLDYGTTKNDTGDFSWRFPLAFQLVLLLPILGLSLIIPDSPRWYAFHERNDEARSVVARLLGHADNHEHPVVEERLREITDSVALEKAVSVNSWKSLFAKDSIGSRTRLFCACSLQFFQQLGGINAMIYYAVFLFNTSLGFSASLGALMSGALFSWFFLASFIPWFLIDSLGRKPLLLGSIALMTATFAAMTGLVRQIDLGAANASACGVAATVMVFLYLGAFTTGFQATVWVYTPEILPLKIRAKGTALATFCNWIINFAVVKIFPIAIVSIGWRTYIIFTIFNAGFLPVIYFVYVETKGRSLEEIDMLFGDSQFQEGAKHLHDRKPNDEQIEKTM